MKKVCQIKLNTINEVKEFVNIVLQCPYDVDLVSGRYIIDAKSLMGIFSLDLTRPIDLEADIDSDDVEELLKKIYEPFGLPIVSVKRRSAEMIKYACNDFLALKISAIS